MNYTKRVLLSTLSLFIWMTVSAPQAVAAVSSYGVITAQGKWKVGTVSGQGEAPYCSMVNEFEKEVVFALSRNADGESSVALAFNNELFNPGSMYDVTMQTDRSKKPRKYTGRANSAHAVIVQLGENDAIYKSLGESSSLKVALADIVEASLALHKFGTPYTSLQECAGALHAGPKTAAAPVTRVEKETLPGSSIAPTATAAAAPATVPVALVKNRGAEVDQLKQVVANKSIEIAKMQQAQKEQEAATVAAASKQAGELALRIVELQRERDALQAQLAENGTLKMAVSQAQADLAIGQTQIADLERQMLVVNQEKQDLNARIAAQDAQLKQMQETQASKDQDIIAAKTGLSVNAEKLATLQADYSKLKEAYEQLQSQLNEKTAQYSAAEKELAEHNKNLPAVFKTAADLAAKKEETAQLQQQLDQSLAERQAAISSAAKAQTERDALNAKLTQALAQPPAQDAAKVQQELAATKSQVNELKARLDAQSRQTKLLEQALSAKEQLMSAHRRDTERRQAAAEHTRAANDMATVKTFSGTKVHSNEAMPEAQEANSFLDKIMTFHKPGAELDDMQSPPPKMQGRAASVPASPSDPGSEFSTVIIQ